MKNNIFLSGLLITIFCTISCSDFNKQDQSQAKEEIAKAEKNFEKMVAEKGIAEAFTFFADSNAVIKRSEDSLIRGKTNIQNYYADDYYKTATVSWTADFIEVSKEGDLGYTYGKYTWQKKDSSGNLNESHGIFHTVWKKQKDGSWRYVWD